MEISLKYSFIECVVSIVPLKHSYAQKKSAVSLFWLDLFTLRVRPRHPHVGRPLGAGVPGRTIPRDARVPRVVAEHTPVKAAP